MALVNWQDALNQVMAHCHALDQTKGPVSSIPFGSVLCEAAHADFDSPPFLKALMDGYALAGGVPADVDGWPIAGKNLAGDHSIGPLEKGWACHIATGAPLPTGADRVIPREQTREMGERVVLEMVPGLGSFTAQPGSDFRKGDRLIPPGAILNAGTAAALATAGKTDISFIPGPEVAIVSTGSELVEPENKPFGSKIRNSNGAMLYSAVQGAGGSPKYLGLAPDDEFVLKNRLSMGLQHPVMVITGGVSVGEKDLVRASLESLGVKILIHGIRLKPGKPFLFGVSPKGCLVFGLPGNPTSSLANFDLFVRPALLKLRGHMHPDPVLQKATLRTPMVVDNNRPTMRPIRIENGADGLQAIDLGARGSYESGILARASGWMFLDPGKWELAEGAEVTVLVPLLSEIWAQLKQMAR